jgi:hypothetical protein
VDGTVTGGPNQRANAKQLYNCSAFHFYKYMR